MLDPEIATLVPTIDMREFNLEQLRNFGSEFAASMSRPELRRVENHSIEGPAGEVPIRLYYPDVSEPLGLIVFIHGGGWCTGSLETHDGVCRHLCHFTGFAVGAVDYRLAPEHKFPAGLEDAEAATVWMLDNASSLGCDPARVVVMGDSAGGNLAAVIAQRLRQRKGPELCYQVLVFPLTDFSMPFPSYERHASGPGLTTDSVLWCRDHYLANPAEDQTNPDASPYLRRDLSGCPPAFVMTAEVDPLCDDGEAYGQRLVEAGVPVAMKRYLGMPHGFLGLPIELPRVQGVYKDIRHMLLRDVTA